MEWRVQSLEALALQRFLDHVNWLIARPRYVALCASVEVWHAWFPRQARVHPSPRCVQQILEALLDRWRACGRGLPANLYRCLLLGWRWRLERLDVCWSSPFDREVDGGDHDIENQKEDDHSCAKPVVGIDERLLTWHRWRDVFRAVRDSLLMLHMHLVSCGTARPSPMIAFGSQRTESSAFLELPTPVTWLQSSRSAHACMPGPRPLLITDRAMRRLAGMVPHLKWLAFHCHHATAPGRGDPNRHQHGRRRHLASPPQPRFLLSALRYFRSLRFLDCFQCPDLVLVPQLVQRLFESGSQLAGLRLPPHCPALSVHSLRHWYRLRYLFGAPAFRELPSSRPPVQDDQSLKLSIAGLKSLEWLDWSLLSNRHCWDHLLTDCLRLRAVALPLWLPGAAAEDGQQALRLLSLLPGTLNVLALCSDQPETVLLYVSKSFPCLTCLLIRHHHTGLQSLLACLSILGTHTSNIHSIWLHCSQWSVQDEDDSGRAADSDRALTTTLLHKDQGGWRMQCEQAVQRVALSWPQSQQCRLVFSHLDRFALLGWTAEVSHRNGIRVTTSPCDPFSDGSEAFFQMWCDWYQDIVVL